MPVEEDTTSAESDVARSEVSRSGEPWTAAEHEHLIWALRNGQVVRDFARDFGRSPGGGIGPLQNDAPSETKRPAWGARLRDLLAADPNYDWQAGVREDALRRGTFYWDSRPRTHSATGGNAPDPCWRWPRPPAQQSATSSATSAQCA